MSQQTSEVGITDVFAPGNIVRLREPYKLMDFGDCHHFWTGDRRDWQAWPGFTHGIVAEVITRANGPAEWGAGTGDITRVSLHLFDPARALLYVGHGYTVPTYCDFHVKELIPHKIATEEGYATLPELGEEDDDADWGRKCACSCGCDQRIQTGSNSLCHDCTHKIGRHRR